MFFKNWGPLIRKKLTNYSETSQSLLVIIAEGQHPFPFRIRPLSLPAPMVLAGQLAGRVGRRQLIFYKKSLLGSQARVAFFIVSILVIYYTYHHPLRLNRRCVTIQLYSY